MSGLAPPTIAAAFVGVRTPVADELARTLALIDGSQVEQVAAALLRADRLFMLGAGRSGLAMRMGAMRLMHLGRTVFVVGEATTPAIGAADLLIVASGSGTTSGVVAAAKKARTAGASVVAITTDGGSLLAAEATCVLCIPAAAKLDRSGDASIQYAGSLFEQAVMMTLDILFHALWTTGTQSADDLWKRHANLE